jgi:Fe2+ or Zn2+ uptake regulation protein
LEAENLDKWRDKLRAQGMKVTPQRLLILQALEDFADEAHPGAEEIWNRIAREHPEIPKATVYRILNSLAGMGLINELYLRDGKTRYEISHDHHHHFICLSCRKTEKIMECPVSAYLETEDCNRVISHSYEVFGYCSECNRSKGEPHHDEKP